MISGPRRWPGKWKMTPSNALAWQKAHQVRILATAETLAGDSGGWGYEVSMAFYGRDGASGRFGFKKRDEESGKQESRNGWENTKMAGKRAAKFFFSCFPAFLVRSCAIL